MNYNFPKAKFIHNDLLTQVKHTLSECEEVKHAINHNEIEERIFEECIDVIHSAETLLRILIDELDENYVNELITNVVAKNRKRGYYIGE